MSETGRWALPLLEAGQAQKEMGHNEALARLDLLTQAGVEAVGTTTPPAAPAIGQAWIVGAVPTGVWGGHAGAVAGWTAGGWRFVAPREGMTAWSVADGCPATFVGAGGGGGTGGSWRIGRLAARTIEVAGVPVVGAQRAAIAAPAGGTTVDTQARAALAEVLVALRGHGLIAV